jgi:hypothetical protein
MKKHKISEMILKVAEEYINMGETTEDRENYLRSACSAWNIACLPLVQREQTIKKYSDQFQKINKSTNAACRDIEENMRKLINQKDKLYPDVNIQIINSRIDIIDGKEHVMVATINSNI